MYDAVTNTWKTLAPIPIAGRAIGDVIGGRFFVVVHPSTGGPRSYEYIPGSNVWRSRPAPQWEHDGVVRVVLDGTAHLFAAGDADRIGGSSLNSELYTR
jgi:hypothetical protein